MKVKWTESSFYDYGGSEGFIDRNYTGEVIDTKYSWFWGTTNLTVACSDNRVRNVNADKVEIIE